MATLLVHHKVRDYDKWKQAFDDHADFRRGSGERGVKIYHVQDDPTNLMLLFEWSSAEDARNFMESESLKKAMDAAGVLDWVEVFYLEEAAADRTAEVLAHAAWDTED